MKNIIDTFFRIIHKNYFNKILYSKVALAKFTVEEFWESLKRKCHFCTIYGTAP